MRDRLIELIGSEVCEDYSPTCDEWQPHSCEKCYANDCKIGELADYLLENGVIVPPCKVGDELYFVVDNKVSFSLVEKISLELKARFNTAITFNYIYLTRFFDPIPMDCIGKTVFLTKEEAEKALRKEDEEK